VEGHGYSHYAISVRDCVERCLANPVQSWHVATDTYSWVSPVDDSFHLDGVVLRGDSDAPIIDIFFRWDGEPDRLGIAYAVGDQLFGPDALPDAYISIYVQEDLLAMGFGVENAHRKPGAGVTWLDWPRSSCLKH